jgi:hypothetical protein
MMVARSSDADRWMLRLAEARDAPVIADLVRLAFSTQARPTTPLPSALSEAADTATEHLGRGGGAVVEEGGTIIGTVLWNEEDGGALPAGAP